MIVARNPLLRGVLTCDGAIIFRDGVIRSSGLNPALHNDVMNILSPWQQNVTIPR